MQEESKTINFFDFIKPDTPLLIEPRRLHAMTQYPLIYSETELAEFKVLQAETNRKPYQETANGIAVISIHGTLVSYEPDFLEQLFGLISYNSIQSAIKSALSDSDITGILLDINSPGGEAAGQFDLVDYIYESRGEKPIYAIANQEAFSAAYGIASAADVVFLPKTGGVGSVGTVAVHRERSKMLEETGITVTVIRAGKYKAEANPVEPLSEHAENSIQTEVDRIYEMFVEQVARNRGMSTEAVKNTEAQLYYGPNAVETVNFADSLGNIENALESLSQSLKGNNEIMPNENKSNQVLNNQESAPAPVQQAAPAVPAPVEQQAAPAQEPTPSTMANQEAIQIMEICNKAGMSEKAEEFLKDGLKFSQVCQKIIELQAAPINAPEQHIDNSSTHQNDLSGPTQLKAEPIESHDEIYARREAATKNAKQTVCIA